MPTMLNRPLQRELASIHDQGRLHIPDPALAGRQLIALTLGLPQLVRTMLADHLINDDDIETFVASGVDVFLRAAASTSAA